MSVITKEQLITQNDPNPSECAIGNYIKFAVISNLDNNIYSGRIVSICDYDTARIYSDVAATHQEMLQSGIEFDIDITQMRFIIVQCYDDVRRAFAFDPNGQSWFYGNRVKLIDPGSTYFIKVFNSTKDDVLAAVTLLRDRGYVCKIAVK